MMFIPDALETYIEVVHSSEVKMSKGTELAEIEIYKVWKLFCMGKSYQQISSTIQSSKETVKNITEHGKNEHEIKWLRCNKILSDRDCK